jgi:hypothetical protein
VHGIASEVHQRSAAEFRNMTQRGGGEGVVGGEPGVDRYQFAEVARVHEVAEVSGQRMVVIVERLDDEASGS